MKNIELEDKLYEEWLTTITNTRLICNTMSELEDLLDNHSIHNNGIKRCFYTSQKLRSAFRDLTIEVSDMTGGNVSLKSVMSNYRKSWKFYKANLARRTDPQAIVLDLLSFYYSTAQEDVKLGKKKQELYGRIVDEEINLAFLILLILKIVPGYDSKDGDVVDMPRQYEIVINLLDRFTSNGSFFSTLPVITNARAEPNKCRIMLLYHLDNILTVYESMLTSDSMYETSSCVKKYGVDFELDGYWNESDGLMQSSTFWKIEHAQLYSQYFATKYYKSSDMKLTAIRYSVLLSNKGGGRLSVYMIHPEAISHKIKGVSFSDCDHVWYTSKMPTVDEPMKLPLKRMFASAVWPLNINLTKITDKDGIALLDRWINKDCELVKPFENCEYDFRVNLYAVTLKALYIPTAKEGWYYRVPIDAAPGLDHVKLSDYVGVMTMGNATYLAFDELMLFISTSVKSLAKYGIKKVNCID